MAEPFARIEHLTAGFAEERRQDREESRRLWRDTQRQIFEIAANLNNLTLKIADTNDSISRTNDTISRLAVEMREADARLAARIESLVSAIGAKL